MAGTSSQPKVSDVNPPTLSQNIEAGYAKRCATMLGFLHVFCGVVVLIADIALTVRHTKCNSMSFIFGSHFFTGIWTSGFFLISGGLAVGGGRSGNKNLVVATLVFSVISAVTAVFLIIHSSVALDNARNYDSDSEVFSHFQEMLSHFHLEMDNQEYDDFQKKREQDYLNGLNSTQLAEFQRKREEYEQNGDACQNPSSGISLTRADLIGHLLLATVAPSVQLIAGLLMLVAGISSALLVCRPLMLTLHQNIEATYATMLGFLHVFCGVTVLIADIALTVRHTKFCSMSSVFGSHFFTGIWTSAFFLISGGIALRGGLSGNKNLVVATLVFSIISAVTAGFLIIHSSVALDNSNYDKERYSFKGFTRDGNDNQELDYEDFIDALNPTQLAEHKTRQEENRNDCSSGVIFVHADFAGHHQVATVASSVEITMGLLMLVAGILSSLLTCRPLFCAPRKTTTGGSNSLNFSLADKAGVELPPQATVVVEKESGHGGNYCRF